MAKPVHEAGRFSRQKAKAPFLLRSAFKNERTVAEIPTSFCSYSLLPSVARYATLSRCNHFFWAPRLESRGYYRARQAAGPSVASVCIILLSPGALHKNSVGAVSDRDYGLQHRNLARCRARSASETPPTTEFLCKATLTEPGWAGTAATCR